MAEAERWQQVKRLLADALERPAFERAAFLRAECDGDAALEAEVLTYLVSEEDLGDFIAEPLFSLLEPLDEPTAGSEVGPYRLIEMLGRGGMGTVFLAERVGEFEQRVAIKLLRAGLDSAEILARFRSERQILAQLSHPNIARLMDGGSTVQGRPYFVMEAVEGEPIDRYCAERRLSLRELLELFLGVCSAVAFAHRNLVVHRDLKPANILVTGDGTPKLLDFGIAKLVGDGEGGAHTALGRPTPKTDRYASPEQFLGGAITTATDVYSLGVVLYELLTGEWPYATENGTKAEVQRIVCEDQPFRPSAVMFRTAPKNKVGEELRQRSRELRGDLDTILLQALRKKPERRYSSVEAFAKDLRRHLDGHPVLARGESALYRAGKFVRRHRIGVGTSATILVLGLALGITYAVQQAAIARQNRQIRTERDRAEAVREVFLSFLAEVDSRTAKGKEATVREALSRRAAQLEVDTSLDPATRAAVFDVIGVGYRSLGLYAEAEAFLKEAMRLRRVTFGPDHFLMAESLHNLAGARRSRGDEARAEPMIRQAIAIQRRAFPAGHRDLARGLNNLASLLRSRAGKAKDAEAARLLTEAEALAREGLAMKERLLGPESVDGAQSLTTLALVLASEERGSEAEPLYRRSIAMRRKLEGPKSPGLAATMNNLAALLFYQRRFKESEALQREALALRRSLYPDGHPDTAKSLINLARVREELGDLGEARKLLMEALHIEEEFFGEESREARDVGERLTKLGPLKPGRPRS